MLLQKASLTFYKWEISNLFLNTKKKHPKRQKNFLLMSLGPDKTLKQNFACNVAILLLLTGKRQSFECAR